MSQEQIGPDAPVDRIHATVPKAILPRAEALRQREITTVASVSISAQAVPHP